jgi:hypothetical protein
VPRMLAAVIQAIAAVIRRAIDPHMQERDHPGEAGAAWSSVGTVPSSTGC